MIIAEEQLVWNDLVKISTHQPDKIALLDRDGRSLTYSQLLEHVDRAHASLALWGLSPGDTVIALLPNAIETVILFLASLRGGFTYAPLPCTATLAEISRWKTLTKAQICLVASPVSASLQKEMHALNWLVQSIEIGSEIHWSKAASLPVAKGGRLVMASSGSTGEPKAIVLDSNRLWSSGKAFLRFHEIHQTEVRFWNYLPMSYLGGLFNLTLIPLAAGGSVFVDEAFNGKTFLVFWATIERFKINSLWLVPTILRGLVTMAEKTGQVKSRPMIEHCFLGTAPASLSEKQKFAQVFGIQPLENYGLSETTFISSERRGKLAWRLQGTVGEIMPDVEVQWKNTLAEDDSAQEILVRTPYAMLGYLDYEGNIHSASDGTELIHTGDFGRVTNGQLQISGRRRDIIKKGGVLILLREIELVAESFPHVIEAMAVGIPHSFYGESCNLFVRIAPQTEKQERFLSELTSYLHEQLGRHKWPEHITCCEDFPRTASGKVQKHLLHAGSATYA